METLTSYDPDEVLSLVPDFGKRVVRKTFTLEDGRSFNVKMNSKRLRLFKKNQRCVCCGLEGAIIVLERQGDETPHLNMYGIDDDDNLILMTKDHIVPASRQGSNALDNLQTMCAVCNGLKGGFPITNEELKEVRAKYLSLREGGMTHKKATHIIEAMKTEMCETNEQKTSKRGE